MNRLMSLGWFAVLTAITAPVVADLRDAEEAIEYRQSVYKAIKWHMDPMTAMVRGDIDYDAVRLTRHAQNVHALSEMLIEGFVPGSDLGAYQGVTGARSEIWERWEEFEEKMGALNEQSQALVIASTSGDMRGNIRPAFAALGQACKSCHDEFRQRR
ncbi:c-type cytochrome [Nitrincola alkalilacustris]|uniref:c-type cytochrome n=1 Tax=Nitrincola alkalilacustris TaxID=1571224 RepID=UPI00124E0DEE|nr:cytochrome c [Nitrincola alkalilacustris]